MKKSLLFLFFPLAFIGCNILDSAPYGNCEIYFFSSTQKEYITRRGECTVTEDLLQVTDSNGAKHEFYSNSDLYSYQEGDFPYNNKNGGVTVVGRIWSAYEAGNPKNLMARVILDFSPV